MVAASLAAPIRLAVATAAMRASAAAGTDQGQCLASGDGHHGLFRFDTALHSTI
jgi:hypothetical protein